LLLEPQSTNLIAYSEDFSDSSWNAVTDVIIDKGYLAPDGSMNATKVTVSGVNPKVALLSGNGSKSIYARTVSGTGTAYFAGQNGVEVISNVTEQWQRFEVNDSPLNNFYAVDFRGASTLTEVIIWGAQRETLPYATSYIPTQGATSTRIAETCNNSGSAQDFNSEEGVLYVEIAALSGSGGFRAISLNDGGENNRVMIRYEPTENNIYFFTIKGGVIQSEIGVVLNNSSYFNKLALSWKTNEVKSFVNGIQVGVTDTSALSPLGLNKLSFDRGDGGNTLFAKVKQLQVYDTALTDSELEYITSFRSLNELVTTLKLNKL
jgi:hypothetical protein